LVFRILDNHSHFAADALEACGRHQRHDIIGATVLPLLYRQIDRFPSEERSKTVSGKIDFNLFGFDFHAALQRHERRFDRVRCLGSEFIR
jgi:hypothetical protein